MEVLFCDSAKGSAPYNQDICGSSGTIYWVMDGATALYGSRFTNDDVHYAMTALNQELREVDTTLPLNIVLRSAIQMASQRITAAYPDFFAADPWRLPTFALCLCSITPASTNQSLLRYAILGDCFIDICPPAGTLQTYSDARFAQISQQNKERIAALDKSSPHYQSSALAIYQDARKTLNTPGGYWIGSFDERGLNYMITGEVSLRPGTHIALYSDGVMKDITGDSLFDYYGGQVAPVLAHLTERITHGGGGAQEVLKKQDDASAIVLRVEPSSHG